VAVVLVGLGGALGGAALAGATSAIAPPIHTSSVDTRLIVEGESGHTDAGVRSAFRQAELLADLAVGAVQLQRIGQALDPPAGVSELVGAISARRQPDLLVITFSARDADPSRAAAIATAAADNLVAITDGRNSLARIRVERLGPATVPEQPSHRHLPRNVAMGVIGGATLAMGVALTVRARRREPDPSEVASITRPVDVRALAVGVGLGAIVLGGIALGLPESAVQAAALVAVIVAVVSPGAGLATIAVTVAMPEPPGFAWLSYPALLTGATAYGLILAAAAGRSRPPLTALSVMAFGYLAVSAVSVVPALTGLDGERTVNAAARLFQVGGGVLLVAVSWSYFARRDPRPHLVLMVCAAALAGLLGISQYAAGGSAGLSFGGLIVDPPGDVIARANGPFSNPNYFGYFLAVSVVLALALAATGGRMRLLALASIPIGVGLLLTFSRGALLAAGLGVVALIWTKNRVAGFALALIAMTVFIAFIPFLLELRSGVSGVPAPENFGDDISDSGRFEAMLSAFPVWRLDPIFGAGFGQYDSESAWFVGSSPATSSHNEYLSLIAEQGVLGVALFVGLAVLTVTRFVRRPGWSRGVALAPLIAFASGAMIIEPLASLQTSGLMWLTIGAAGAVAGASPSRSPAGLDRHASQSLPLARAPARAGVR
jgi:O-antigen ligase/capsular polysaccharide biosynthesis protein